jgi:predicted metal-dependent phosphoesterase TrpH
MDAISKALQLPNGARFYRCALQVNPHHYASTFRGAPSAGDSSAYAKAVVEKAIELGISVLAITDHNDVSSVPQFRAAAEGRDVHVFPGFELSSSEGVHVLCIYPKETDDHKLGRFLGEFGITNTAPSTDPAQKSFVEILDKVRKQGGVTIAAHATNDRGLFTVLSGQPRVNAWRHQNLRAIQIPGTVMDLPQDVRQIVENKNSDYRRDDAADDNLAVAVVNARDVAKPDDLADPAATCWVKMSDVSIEGLKQAFLDPGSRIRLSQKSVAVESDDHAELVAMAWEGGFLDGAMVRFNPNLNVLVGGRGTGKSTIIESIRAVLALDAIGDEARKAHEGIVRHVLKNGTKISLLIRAHRPSVRDYRIERTIPNPPIVREDRGNVSNLTPADVLPRLEVYGQHEISELTKSREKLTRLLERFIDTSEPTSGRKDELRRALEKNRRELIEARGELQQIEDRLAALPGLEETLQRFREAGLEDRLKDQSLLVREERVLASIPERTAPLRDCLETIKEQIPIERSFLSASALEGLPGAGSLMRANDVLEQLERDVQKVVKALEAALQKAEAGIGEIRSEWNARKQKAQAEYERILRELQKSRVDGEEFIRLRRKIEELRPLREQQTRVQRAEKERGESRRALLAEWEDVKANEFRRLDRAAKNVNQKLRDRVQVEVTAAGDREPLLQILRTHVGGRLSEAIDTLRALRDLSLPQFVEACRTGTAAVSKQFNLTPAQAERLTKAAPEVLMRIEELELPSTTAIRLNTAPIGEPPAWQALEDLSTGQKATAVLLLLLLECDAPLVVDQPEDDLDNRFITEGVVPRMRAEKQRRQFIFSTHNANIPVLGDAELIVGLSASGEAEHGHARIASDHMGSIDATPVRELVEEILEGGKEAFERRRRKYGF